MAVIAIASAHGSPGVTTTALALAHHLALRNDARSLLIEADPDGGILASRHTLTLSPGLTDLAGSARGGLQPGDLERFSQPITDHVDAVVAHPSAEQTNAALRAAVAPLANALRAHSGGDVIIDAGRARATSPALPLLAVCDVLLLVLRPTAEGVIAAMNRLEFIERNVSAVGLILIGDQPYKAAEVAHACSVQVVATVPFDTAALNRDPLGARRRSNWSRGLTRVADGVSAATEQLNASHTPIMQLRPGTEAMA